MTCVLKVNKIFAYVLIGDFYKTQKQQRTEINSRECSPKDIYCRHCERSEAIQNLQATGKYGLPRHLKVTRQWREQTQIYP